jgi:hypothetical protein
VTAGLSTNRLPTSEEEIFALHREDEAPNLTAAEIGSAFDVRRELAAFGEEGRELGVRSRQ